MVDAPQLNGVNSHFNDKPQVNTITAVIGAQWGDEGKGKIVDLLAQNADVVCRCQVSDKKERKKSYNSEFNVILFRESL